MIHSSSTMWQSQTSKHSSSTTWQTQASIQSKNVLMSKSITWFRSILRSWSFKKSREHFAYFQMHPKSALHISNEGLGLPSGRARSNAALFLSLSSCEEALFLEQVLHSWINTSLDLQLLASSCVNFFSGLVQVYHVAELQSMRYSYYIWQSQNP